MSNIKDWTISTEGKNRKKPICLLNLLYMGVNDEDISRWPSDRKETGHKYK